MASEIQLKPLEYLAISFEKLIESQHVTRSMSTKAYLLAKDSNEIVENLIVANELSNLSLLLYAHYLENGYVRNKEEFDELHKYFHSLLPIDGSGRPGFLSEVESLSVLCLVSSHVTGLCQLL